MTRPSTPVTRLPLLDGLRGIAAIAVMLYHVGNVFQFHSPFYRGYLFVDIFFILSGFVLTLAAEPKMDGKHGAKRFLWARIKRLWPTIAVGAALGAGVYGLTEGWGDVPLLLVMALLLLPTFGVSWQVFPLNGPQWSLFHELVANALHAVVLRRLGERALLALVLASGALLAFTIHRFDGNDLGPIAALFAWSFPRIVFAYALGVWLARRWRRARPTPLASWQACLAVPVIAAMFLAYLPLPRWLGDGVFTLVLFPALFWMAASAIPPERTHYALDRLGAISFPLYAVHLPVLTLFGTLGRSWPMVISATATALLAAQLFVMAADTLRDRRRKAPALAAT